MSHFNLNQPFAPDDHLPRPTQAPAHLRHIISTPTPARPPSPKHCRSGGAIQRRHGQGSATSATSDWMALEQQGGISVNFLGDAVPLP